MEYEHDAFRQFVEAVHDFSGRAASAQPRALPPGKPDARGVANASPAWSPPSKGELPMKKELEVLYTAEATATGGREGRCVYKRRSPRRRPRRAQRDGRPGRPGDEPRAALHGPGARDLPLLARHARQHRGHAHRRRHPRRTSGGLSPARTVMSSTLLVTALLGLLMAEAGRHLPRRALRVPVLRRERRTPPFERLPLEPSAFKLTYRKIRASRIILRCDHEPYARGAGGRRRSPPRRPGKPA